MASLGDTKARNWRLKNMLAREFCELFGLPISDFWISDLLGFDVVSFDECIIKSGDKPMIEVVRAEYGGRAEQIILKLSAPVDF